MLIRVVDMMEAADPSTAGHSARVANVGAAVAEQLGMDDDAVDALRVAGQLHDIGKVGIRAHVLAKPGALTPEERAHVQEHVRLGVELVMPVAEHADLITAIRDHHERMDGTGYPRGLKGQDISIGGRILGVADVYDALTSHRPHRGALGPVEALAQMARMTARQLDPAVFAALQRVVGPGGPLAR
jgi:putative two-component system response regulator